jgi:hypothetical protein
MPDDSLPAVGTALDNNCSFFPLDNPMPVDSAQYPMPALNYTLDKRSNVFISFRVQ